MRQVFNDILPRMVKVHKTELKALAALYGSSEPPSEAEIAIVRDEERQAHSIVESENRHQARLHAWLKKNHILHFAPANEGKRSDSEIRRLTAVGFTCGVLDIWIMEARKPYHGLIIELKSDGGVVSGAQKYWLESLNARAYKAVVSWSFEESIKAVTDYLTLSNWV